MAIYGPILFFQLDNKRIYKRLRKIGKKNVGNNLANSTFEKGHVHNKLPKR